MNYKIQKNRAGLLSSFWFKNLIVFLILSTNYSIAQTTEAPAFGDGTTTNPYEIATWQNLYWISQDSTEWDKNFIQTADIDFGKAVPVISTWDGGNGWTPIGNNTTPFTGTYDGDSHTIDGLFSQNIQAGLFGKLSGNVKNLLLINASINGSLRAGILAAYATSSTISNCFSSGTVVGELQVGGLAGLVSNTTITNCANSGNVVGTNYTGGLVGLVSVNNLINNSYNTGNVVGTNFAGGLVGRIIGNSLIINNCYSTGQVSGTRSGGLVGFSSPSEGNNNFWDMETSGQLESDIGTGKSTAEMKTQSTFTGWDFVNTWQIGGDNYPSLRVFIDNSSPVANAGLDQIIDCAPLAGAEVTLNGSGSDEDGDVLTYSWSNGATTASQTLLLAPGTHTFTLIVNDGNVSSTPDTVSVTIKADLVAPVLTCPDAVTLELGVAIEAVYSGPGATAIDSCDDSPVVTSVPTLPANFTSAGIHVITYTAVDANGNSSICEQQITVIQSTMLETTSTIAALEALLTGDRKKDKKINEAQRHIEKSLAVDQWEDEYHLDPKKGKKVFEEAKEAVHQLMKIVEDKNTDQESKDGVKPVINTLVSVDRTLAQTVIDEVTAVCLDSKCQGDVGKANKEMVKAEEEIADGNYDKAISKYKKAWERVSKKKKDQDRDNEGFGKIVAEKLENVVPTEYVLSQNYPNPFNPTTTINYGIPKDGMVTLIVYNAQGELIEEIVNSYQSAGNYSYNFDGSRLSSGVYFYKIISNNFMQTSKMLLIK